MDVSAKPTFAERVLPTAFPAQSVTLFTVTVYILFGINGVAKVNETFSNVKDKGLADTGEAMPSLMV